MTTSATVSPDALAVGAVLVGGLNRSAPMDDTSTLVEMAFRILTDEPAYPQYAPTREEIERFKLHVIRMRLCGYLTQELALRLINRADLRALTLSTG